MSKLEMIYFWNSLFLSCSVVLVKCKDVIVWSRLAEGHCLRFPLRCTSRRPHWPSPSASAPPSLWACSTCRRSTSSSSTPSRTSPNGSAASRPSSPPPPWPASCRTWRPSGPMARWRQSCARAWRPAVSGWEGRSPTRHRRKWPTVWIELKTDI